MSLKKKYRRLQEQYDKLQADYTNYKEIITNLQLQLNETARERHAAKMKVYGLKQRITELQDQFDQLCLVNIENCKERDTALNTQHYWETQAAVLQSKLDEEQNTSQYWYDVAENRRRLLLDVNNTSDYYEGLDDALLILSKGIEQIKDNDNDSA